MENENSTISVCKGIGIILMVIGYSGCPKLLHDFIYLFHMPLFFIITGYLFKELYLDSPLYFLKRKIHGLYRPFILSNLIVLFAYFLYDILTNSYQNSVIYIISCLKIICFTGQLDILGSLWFLKTLFFSNVIIYILIYITYKNKWVTWFPLFVALILLILGYVIFVFKGQVIYDIQREFITPILLLIGIMFKRVNFLLKSKYFILIISFAVILFASLFFTFDIAGSQIYNPIIFLFISIIGFYLVYGISAKLNKIKLLIFIGNNTLPILILHQIGFYSLYIILNNNNMTFHKLQNNTYWILYSIYAIVFSLLVNYVYEQFKKWKCTNLSSLR